jgi:hypothetical protein
MATLYITEYERIGAAKGIPAPIAQEPAVAEQAVTFTTATASAAFGGTTRYVRIVANADAHIKFGADPTATTSHQWIAVGTEYWRGVLPGQKVSAVTAT